MSLKSKKVPESEFSLSTTEDFILWPEWSDATLNKENWANPKNGSDGLFVDTRPVDLPSSLDISEWIRAKNLKNLTESVTVFVATSEYPDLIANNEHILHSEFTRWVISALINLQYCGRDGLEISGENSNFIWNGRYQSWRGWMHVYSMNKAGKGANHRPTVNPNGKYVVRLYFLGSWRYIVVDDMIPVNSNGVPVLPRTSDDHELWPMLLSKALLKLCSLTWFEGREIVDFHPVHCLTGWVCLRLEIGYLSPQDKWDFLRKYADHFEWKAETVATEQGTSELEKTSEEKKPRDTTKSNKSKDTEDTKKSKDLARSKKSKDTDRTKKSKDTGRSKRSKGEQKPVALEKPEPVTLFLGLEDMQKLPSETVPGLSPCWSHFIYVAQARDVPLDPKDVKPPLARWKLFRWLKWAIEQGIIDPDEYFVPIRSLKVVSPLKRFDESVVNKYRRVNIDDSDLQGDPASEKSEKRKGRDKSKESKKGSSKKSLKEVEQSRKSLPDVSFWADFNKMEPYIRDVHFFYKLDYFEYTARVSDRFKGKDFADHKSESRKGSKKDSRGNSPVRVTSDETKFVDVYCWPREMLRTRNEPLYIFVDSVEEKFFLINFSTFQIPVDSRSPASDSKHTNITTQSSARLSDSLIVSSFAQSVANKDYLIIERHSWFHRQKYGNDLVYLPTSGTKATVLELEPGRHLLRVYCDSETNCFTTISSDTIFYLGDRRKIYELMCTESDTIDLKVKHISNCVSVAYQTFGTDEFPDAIKLYYKSYMPPGPIFRKRIKTFYYYIHLCFLAEKVRLIRNFVPEDQVQGVVRALRIFFLNPLIGLQYFNPFSQALKAIRETSMPRTSVENTKLFMADPMEQNVLNKDYAASVIQSFFKMLIIRKYKKIHNPTHEEHQNVLQNLLKIVELFNYNKRESLASSLFRYILKHFDRLRDIYPCSKDFEYTIQTQELTGTLKMLKPEQWTPIVRLMVNTRTGETVFANIDLFINLPRYCVRVFNNDTKQEMLRVVNNVVPTRYEHTKLGYTIFAYGWNDDQPAKELTWTMLMITKKAQPMFYTMDRVNTPSTSLLAPFLVTEELSNNYIPNNSKSIARWVTQVSRPTLVSFRLHTTYEKVKIRLIVINTDDDVLFEISGTTTVILPVVYLGQSLNSSMAELNVDIKLSSVVRNVSNSEVTNNFGPMEDSIEQIEVNRSNASRETPSQQTYYVEAFVLDDSWPLNKSEWAVVTEVKSKRAGSTVRSKTSVLSLSKLSRTESAKIRRASKVSSDTNYALQKPYWVLQVVSDLESGFEIAEDKTKEEKIAKMKETWAKENPDSLARGKKLREEFRAKHEIKPDLSDPSIRLFTEECCPDALLETRTLEPPQSLRKLPSLNLSAYKIKEDEEDTPWLKTPYDEETLRNTRLANIIYAREDYNCSIEEISVLMKNRKERYQILFGEHYDSVSGRRTLVENVYEARKSYLTGKKITSPKDSKKSAKSKSSKSKKV